MRIHFFSRIDPYNRPLFRSYCTLQNIKTVKTLSLVYLIVSVCLRAIVVINDLPIHNINHIEEFNANNWMAIATTPFFYGISYLLIKYFDHSIRMQFITRIFVLVFALFIMVKLPAGMLVP